MIFFFVLVFQVLACQFHQLDLHCIAPRSLDITTEERNKNIPGWKIINLGTSIPLVYCGARSASSAGMPSRAAVKSSRPSVPGATIGLKMSPTPSSWGSAERGARSASSPGMPSRAAVKSSRASVPGATIGLKISPTTSSWGSAERGARSASSPGIPSRAAVKSSSKSATSLVKGPVMAVMAANSPSSDSKRLGMEARSPGSFSRAVITPLRRFAMSAWMGAVTSVMLVAWIAC
jgi:hypothetical protein